MISLACLLLSLLVMYLVLSPILSAREDQSFSPESAAHPHNLSDKLQRLHQLLQDLELDHLTGKINQSEYESMRMALEQELGAQQPSMKDRGA